MNHLSTSALATCTNGMPASAGPWQTHELFERVRTVIGIVIHVDDGDGSVRAGIQRLAEELGVLGVDAAFEDAVVLELLRLVAEQHHDFAADVDVRVIVVVVLGAVIPYPANTT